MAQNCYICNRQDGGVEKTKLNIFDTKTPMSAKNVYEILHEISGMVVRDECKRNNNLCAKCYKALLEYDYLLARLNEMKADIRDNIIRSEDIRITQEKIKKEATMNERSGKITDNVMKRVKLVVPASKLQPLPPGFDLKLKASHNFALSKPNPVKTEYDMKLKASHDFAISKPNQVKTGFDLKLKASHNIALSKPNPVKTFQPKVSFSQLLQQQTTTATTPTTTQQQFKQHNDIKNQIATEMPIILPSDITTLLDKKEFSLNDFVVVKETKDDENNDDHPMEIDEDAMIMEAENASILGVVSHQKFLYGNSEISLMMPHPGVAMGPQDDGQDSNSESHIELQVSGDEETAKAIIAAATEQGGTFIKVDSGEMFEVKSIESKIQDTYKVGEDTLRLDDNMVEIADGQFKCLFCERSQKTVKSEPVLGKAEWMMEHLKTVHSARLYICNCGAIIRKRADFSAHLENHADKLNNLLSPQTAEKLSKLHECEICKKKFSSRLVLTGHMNMHTGKRPYTCDLCDKSFASRYTQQAHMKTHTERPRPFKCNECGKSFFTQHNLNHHEKIHLGSKDFVCTVCGKAFGTQHNLEVHGVVHSGLKPFVCTVCDKGFARRAEVRDHMRIHTGERPFECETCGARFSQRSNLHSHKRATHLNDKRHQCPHCTKRFKRRRLLEYHIKSSHTGERPLKCDVCSATFIYPEHYKKHIRIHSGEKPYVCEVCGKGFNSRDNRNVHRFVHSDRKPYECVLCGAGYMRKHLLYQHMNSTGHLSESIVVNQPRVGQMEDEESKIQSVIISEDNKDDELMNAVYETEALQVLAANDKVVQTQGNTTTQYILSTENFENSEQIEGTVLENITADQLEETHILSDGNNTVRLIQIQLADGGCGWVAVSQ